MTKPNAARVRVKRQVPDPERNPTMTVDQAAEVFGISRNSGYEAVKTGAIPSIRLGGRILVPTAVVREMLRLDEKRRNGAAGGDSTG